VPAEMSQAVYEASTALIDSVVRAWTKNATFNREIEDRIYDYLKAKTKARLRAKRTLRYAKEGDNGS
jgi:hypothetical protein